MHKLKHVATGAMLALAMCGLLTPQAHAGPHGGGGGGWHGGGGGRGGDWHGGGGGWRGGGWRGGGWGWGGWGGYYSPAYAGWGWGYPAYPWGWGGWGGGWGWGWGGAYAGAAMGAAAASASYRASPEIYNATGNTAPEDDSVYDRDLSTLVSPPAAAPKPRPTCPAGQVYNDLTESCDRP
ncbi:hypothetical protein [Komagataeibacter sp. FNDCF1]|uniref:hypothetical protein n=1 Tax=Komagataeibacter sp. FNDCF1 TaxID=2878681 RepID=UPI001E3EC207|nr:hypothetical protein [Komagataeibacter sp. FNDCF1]MCE2565455.1 hypothetical protein [Komagataeibacter sp. FNDCF1]